MKITVEQPKCVSAGNCVAHAPDIFDQDEDDGSVILLDDDPAADLQEAAREAAAACPAHAILIDE